VSRTDAEWPLNRGIRSGSLPRSDKGMIANAPPPTPIRSKPKIKANDLTSGVPIEREVQGIDFDEIAIPRCRELDKVHD
jgi:hypothetical protein